MASPVSLFRLKANPTTWVPGSLYFIKPDGSDIAESFITDLSGNPFPVASTESINEILATYDFPDTVLPDALRGGAF